MSNRSRVGSGEPAAGRALSFMIASLLCVCYRAGFLVFGPVAMYTRKIGVLAAAHLYWPSQYFAHVRRPGSATSDGAVSIFAFLYSVRKSHSRGYLLLLTLPVFRAFLRLATFTKYCQCQHFGDQSILAQSMFPFVVQKLTVTRAPMPKA